MVYHIRWAFFRKRNGLLSTARVTEAAPRRSHAGRHSGPPAHAAPAPIITPIALGRAAQAGSLGVLN